ncbi:hypothetical protein GEMRC1_004363 [Eukaryota sp. GEM-RC1]
MIDREHHVDLPEVVPGWGDWGGVGVFAKMSKKDKTKKKQLQLKQKESIKHRQDAKKPRVIIREKPESVAKKYTVPRLPWGSHGVKDYERKLSKPISFDFAPMSVHDKAIKPELVVPRGSLIAPIKRSQTQRRKFKG